MRRDRIIVSSCGQGSVLTLPVDVAPMRFVHRCSALVVAVIAAGVLAGCGGTAHSDASTTPTTLAGAPTTAHSATRGTTATTASANSRALAAAQAQLDAAATALANGSRSLAQADPAAAKAQEGTAP